jgi:peptidoglycan lytic transglycosylase
MKQFKGDPLFVAAAYNAGPDAVTTWLSKTSHGTERDEFVESIPFSETRGYVKKVLRNYAEYKRIYSKTSLTTSLVPASPEKNTGSLVKDVEVRTP